MKSFLIALALLVPAPLWAAVPVQPPAASAPASTPAAPAAPQQAVSAPDAPAAESKPILGKGSADNEYVSPYYTVLLPAGWKAVMPPHEQQGNISAIFATTTNSSVVTMIIGPNDGADAQTIASMFAEQFKATGTPVAKGGQYSFRFPIKDGVGQAFVATQGSAFMVTAISGNIRQAQDFLRRAVSSDKWRDLLPK